MYPQLLGRHCSSVPSPRHITRGGAVQVLLYSRSSTRAAVTRMLVQQLFNFAGHCIAVSDAYSDPKLINAELNHYEYEYVHPRQYAAPDFYHGTRLCANSLQ